MDDRRLEAKGIARARARSRRLKVATIRRRTVRSSLALFAILWAIIFAQLASGNDPVLSRNAPPPKAADREVRRASPSAPAPETGSTATAPSEPELEPEPEPSPEVEFEEEPEVEVEAVAEPEPEPEVEAPIVTSSS